MIKNGKKGKSGFPSLHGTKLEWARAIENSGGGGARYNFLYC